MGPIATAATRIDWGFFCTLTYSGNRIGQTVEGTPHFIRRRMLFQWVRKVERAFRIPEGFLLFLAREEQGEKGARFHWHVLLGGLHYVPGRGVIPSPNVNSDRFILEALWRQCGKAAGFPDVREYSSQLSGVEYVLKGLEELEWTYSGANAYELAKFNDSREDRELILAPGFLTAVDRAQSRNRRHRKARDVKRCSRDRSARGESSGGFNGSARLAHPYDDPAARLYV